MENYEKVIKSLTEGQFRVDSKWVKKNDSNVYHYLQEILQDWILEGYTNENELKFFQNGEWIVEYIFSESSYGDGDVEIMITMGQDERTIANSSDIARYTIDYVNYKNFPIEVYKKEINK